MRACMQDPAIYFTHPQYAATANMFWPDAWANTVSDGAYDMHGLMPGPTRVSYIHFFVYYDLYQLTGVLVRPRKDNQSMHEYRCGI